MTIISDSSSSITIGISNRSNSSSGINVMNWIEHEKRSQRDKGSKQYINNNNNNRNNDDNNISISIICPFNICSCFFIISPLVIYYTKVVLNIK